MPISRRHILGGTFASLALAFTACSGASPDPVASSGTGSAGNGQFRTLDQIKSSGTVRIGVFSDKAPFGYIDADGKPAGYDVVYAERIGKDLGAQVDYVPVEAASRVEFLQTAKVDIILANFTVTPERAEKVDFANPYFKVSLGVVSPTSAEITDVSQLAGKTLIVTKGTTAEAYFEANHPEVKLQKYDQYSDAYQALEDGRGDAFSTDNTEVIAWAIQHPGFSVGIKSLGETSYIAAAVKKGNTALLDWLNNQLVELGQENFFHKDYEETLAPVYGDAATPDDLVVEGGVDTTSTN